MVKLHQTCLRTVKAVKYKLELLTHIVHRPAASGYKSDARGIQYDEFRMMLTLVHIDVFDARGSFPLFVDTLVCREVWLVFRGDLRVVLASAMRSHHSGLLGHSDAAALSAPKVWTCPSPSLSSGWGKL